MCLFILSPIKNHQSYARSMSDDKYNFFFQRVKKRFSVHTFFSINTTVHVKRGELFFALCFNTLGCTHTRLIQSSYIWTAFNVAPISCPIFLFLLFVWKLIPNHEITWKLFLRITWFCTLIRLLDDKLGIFTHCAVLRVAYFHCSFPTIHIVVHVTCTVLFSFHFLLSVFLISRTFVHIYYTHLHP